MDNAEIMEIAEMITDFAREKFMSGVSQNNVRKELRSLGLNAWTTKQVIDQCMKEFSFLDESRALH